MSQPGVSNLSDFGETKAKGEGCETKAKGEGTASAEPTALTTASATHAYFGGTKAKGEGTASAEPSDTKAKVCFGGDTKGKREDTANAEPSASTNTSVLGAQFDFEYKNNYGNGPQPLDEKSRGEPFVKKGMVLNPKVFAPSQDPTPKVTADAFAYHWS